MLMRERRSGGYDDELVLAESSEKKHRSSGSKFDTTCRKISSGRRWEERGEHRSSRNHRERSRRVNDDRAAASRDRRRDEGRDEGDQKEPLKEKELRERGMRERERRAGEKSCRYGDREIKERDRAARDKERERRKAKDKDVDNLDCSRGSKSTKEQVDKPDDDEKRSKILNLEKDEADQRVREEKSMKSSELGANSGILSDWENRTSGKTAEERRISADRKKASNLCRVYDEQDNMMNDVESDDDDDDEAATRRTKDPVLQELDDKVLEEGGEAVVSVLKDQSMVTNDGDDINQDQVDDMLEAVENIGDKRRPRGEADRAAAKKKKVGVHDDNGCNDEPATGVETKIVPQRDDDDDDELQKSLERARQIALKRQRDEEQKSSPQPMVIQLLIASSTANISSTSDINPNLGTTGYQPKFVFTETEEFLWSHHLHDEKEEERKPETTRDAVAVEVEDVAAPCSTSDNQKTRDGDNGGWTIHEPPMGKGLAGALKFLKDRGTLKKTDNECISAKKKSRAVGDEDGAEEEIRIERTDEHGRVLTTKEAFRVFSHKFHGKRPGKAKQETRIRQYRRSAGDQF